MSKDYSANKRYEYSQQIAAKEQQLDDYRVDKKRLLDAAENYQEIMTKSFFNLEELNQSLAAQGSRAARMTTDGNQFMASAVRRLVEEYKDDVSEACSKLCQDTQDEIEDLQYERNTLPWDEPKESSKVETSGLTSKTEPKSKAV